MPNIHVSVKCDAAELSFDRDAALAHLKFLFGGLDLHPAYKLGRIEIGNLKQVKFFKLTDMHAAVDYAERRSSNGKIYVHCGLIRPDYWKVARDARNESIGHSAGEGVLCWPVVWGEADHKHLGDSEGNEGEARNRLRLAKFCDATERHGFRWGWMQATGTVPSLRLQGFIRLDEPASPDDPDFWRVVKSISAAGMLDMGATNSSQVLRLAGSLSRPAATQKSDEAGEPQRVLEIVTRLIRADISEPASLATLHLGLELSDALHETRSTLSNGPPAKTVDEIMARVAAPPGAAPLPKKKVRAAVAREVMKASKAEFNRRTVALGAAKFAGGYLWTGAFQVEELWSEGVDIDDPGLSVTAAYNISGGEADNGANGLAEGMLALISSGVAAPLAKILNQPPTDGAAFGDVDLDDVDPDDGGDNPPPRKLKLPKVVNDAPLESLPDRRFVIFPTHAIGVVGALIGQGGVAKTGRGIAEALAVVTGRVDLAGLPDTTATSRANAWIHNGEDDNQELERRTKSLTHK